MTIPAAIQIPIKQLKSTRQQSIINGAALSLQTAQCFVEVRLWTMKLHEFRICVLLNIRDFAEDAV